MASSELYALILAGGSGERFWPLSRKSRPKQLLSLFSEVTLLAATLERIDGLVKRENILILTNTEQEAAVRQLVPGYEVLAEPAKRDTAAAIALGAGWISTRDKNATMVVLPADHVIKDRAGFQQTLRTAAMAAEEGKGLVTIGIKPTWACPGFGYIELGEPVKIGGSGVYTVVAFREKPNPELAETFLRKGNFRWNAGMFVWTVNAILGALNRDAPELGSFVSELHQTDDLPGLLKKRFPSLPKISIDYAVMEKAERVTMVEAGFDWDDVGSWTAVAKYLAEDEHENRANAPLTTIDSRNNIVFTHRPVQVALMGVRDLIVVQTEDALLVCDRHESERIKNLVTQVPAELQ